jgi:class 3 adenylate cyclase
VAAANEQIKRHVEQLLADAEKEAERGNWVQARTLADAVVALDPDNEPGEEIRRRAHSQMHPGDRRQLTVMFCDVVGSTALSAASDPEVTHDLLRSYQEVCTTAVRKHDGHVSQYVGDGVVAYFGYPYVHEDDGRRAVNAGLDLLEGMRDVAEHARSHHGVEFHVRVAVHTGLVVRAELGGPSRGDRDAIVGETPNVAARLQDHARPDSLLISAATERLVRGLFQCTMKGPFELRGIDRPITAYEVTGRTFAETRFEATERAAPFVDRALERKRLTELWQSVEAGGSASILLEGEPGVGKSRLALEFRNHLEAAGYATVSCACSEYRSSTPLYPIRRLLANLPALRGESGLEIEPLRAALADLGRESLTQAFADLLHLPEGGWSDIEIDPQQVRRLVLETLVEWVASAAADSPILAVIEDIHWADASTLELVDKIVESQPSGLMLVATAREGFEPSSQKTEPLVVSRMDEVGLRGMVEALPESRDLTESDIAEVIERSDGIPLCLEELVRAGAPGAYDEGHRGRSDTEFTVPPALLEPLLARLSSPEVDLGLAQVMATIGPDVDPKVLEAVTGMERNLLIDRIDGLIRARVIEQNSDDLGHFRFRHQLVGDVAYETQLLAVRKQRHSEIADILRAMELPSASADIAALAHHLERAERISEAVDAHVRAAGESIAHGAIVEAVVQLDHAFGLLEQVGDDGERLALELTVRQTRGLAWASLAGYSAPAAAEDFERCADLCRELGPAIHGIPSLRACWYYCIIHGQLDRAEEVVLVDLPRFEESQDAAGAAGAWSGIKFGRGEISGAIETMESYLAAMYATDLGSSPEEWPLPDDPVVNTWSVLGLARWIAADTVGSDEAFERGAERAETLDFPHGPFCRAYVLLVRSVVYQLEQNAAGVTLAVEEMAAIGERHGFALFDICANLHGALTRSGEDPEQGIPETVRAFDTFRMLGMDLWNPWGYTVIGENWLAAGDATACLEALAVASSEAERTGSSFWAAETLRLRGLARLRSGDEHGIDDLTEGALLARGQGARLFELRCRIELARALGGEEKVLLQSLLDELDPNARLPELAVARGILGS